MVTALNGDEFNFEFCKLRCSNVLLWHAKVFVLVAKKRAVTVITGGDKKKEPPIFPSAAEHGYLALNPCCKEISCSNFLCKCLIDHLEDSDRHHTPDPLLNSNFLTEPQFQAREVDA